MVEGPILLERVAEATGELKERTLARGVVEYLRSELRRVNAEVIEIRNRCGVDSTGGHGREVSRGGAR